MIGPRLISHLLFSYEILSKLNKLFTQKSKTRIKTNQFSFSGFIECEWELDIRNFDNYRNFSEIKNLHYFNHFEWSSNVQKKNLFNAQIEIRSKIKKIVGSFFIVAIITIFYGILRFQKKSFEIWFSYDSCNCWIQFQLWTLF